MASKRKASLNLDWEHSASGDWMADIPAIPGYTGATGNYSFVTVGPSPASDDWVCGFTIFVPDKGQAYLGNRDLNIPDTATAEEMTAAIDALSPEDIADALEALGYEPINGAVASRKGSKMIRKATRRTASMDLDWMNLAEDVYQAYLPAIPGYTSVDGNHSFVTVAPHTDGVDVAVPWDAVCTIFPSQGGAVSLDLWDMWSFDPFGPDAEDVMQAVDDLDVYDISHQLESMGYEPMLDEEGEYVVASRKVTQRKAHFDLEWEKEEDGSYFAPLPYSYDAYVYDAATVDGSTLTGWWFQITDGYYILDNTDFGIPSAATAEEMMSAVENLTFEDIDKKMISMFPDR